MSSASSPSLYPSMPSAFPLAGWLRAAPVGRALVVAACVWLPIVLFAVVESRADPRSLVPLLRDAEVHVRLLVAVPVLILARAPVSIAIDECIAYFTRSALVARDDQRFAAAVRGLRSDARSRFAEVVILVIAFALAIDRANAVGSWGTVAGGEHLNWAGRWYAYVAVPLHQFLLGRWLYRWIDWDLFVVRMARVDLRLHATHPDRSGGLAFLSQPAIAFALVLFAASSVLAARWGAMLARDPGAEGAVRRAIILYISLVFCLAFAPLFVHLPRLVRLRRDGIHTYGAIGQMASQAFYERWRSKERTGAEFLEANDPCALIDFASDYAIVRSMRIVPVGTPEALIVLLVSLLPLVALAVVNQNVAHALGQLARALV